MNYDLILAILGTYNAVKISNIKFAQIILIRIIQNNLFDNEILMISIHQLSWLLFFVIVFNYLNVKRFSCY